MAHEDEDAPQTGGVEVVDPELRAHIYSLVSALGGSSLEEGGKYELGDDALACLKDLRRWLKGYDEKLNRFDVARCMSEANLVKGDLLEILAAWEDVDTENRTKHRLALACTELLVPLTWPLEKGHDQMTVNHHRHIPVLQHAQVAYKKAILRYKSGKILRSFVRVGLPSMAIPASERTERDEGIIKLVLYLLRNIAMIEHPLPTETDTGVEIARSATIDAFSDQDVLHLLLTISSGMGEEFGPQDVVAIEVLYHLVKSVDVEKLFMSDQEETEKNADDLSTLLKVEDDLRRNQSRTASTRHNRFGTSVWIEREDGRRSFVSGQGALLGKSTGMKKIDSTKKWKKPRGGDAKGISQKTEFDMTVNLEASAKRKLREFVEQFLDSGFNPLFNHIRRAIDRDAERLLNTHLKQYFSLVAWFLEAQRVRRRVNISSKKPFNEEANSFGLVAVVLNQEALITLNRKMAEWFDLKQWTELQAGMRCFTQTLLTVQDMALSPDEDDQEIAENIQNRLFYEETTLDLVVNILRSYTKQPIGWLNDCTEMVHVHLKMLEKYSKQHEHMFIRSRRRQKAKNKQKDADTGTVPDEEDGEDMAAVSKRVNAERTFDFERFEGKLLNQNCIDTFVAFLTYHKELDCSQIKRAITFFHRIFVKKGMEVILFRLDIVELFYRIMQDPDGIPQSHPAYKEMDKFVKYYLKKLTRALEKRPELYVELLFTKMNSSMHYLQHGYDREVRSSKPRAAAELEVSSGLPRNEQIGVAVGALLDENKGDAVDWLKGILSSGINERKSWEAEYAARKALEEEAGNPDLEQETSVIEKGDAPLITIKTDSDERRKAIFKDAKLRLLLTLLGFEKREVDETPLTDWVIPSTLTSENLQEFLDLLKKYTDEPPVYEDGKLAEDFIRRKTKPRAKVFGSSDDEATNSGDEELLFEPGGPTAMKVADREKKPKKKLNRKRNREEEVDEQILEERRKKKEKAEKAKLIAIKSSLYVHDSDDNSDEDLEFFAKEKALRDQGPRFVENEEAPLLDVIRTDIFGIQPPTKKRKKTSKKKTQVNDSDIEGDSKESTPAPSPSAFIGISYTSSNDESNEPPNKPSKPAAKSKVRRSTPEEEEEEEEDVDILMGDDGDDEEVPVAKSRRRGQVVVDSDSE